MINLALQPPSSSLQGFLSLPTSIQARILTYLLPEELAALSRSTEYWDGVENDAALRKIWRSETVPALLSHLLFDKTHCRPDVRELVRLNIIKGIGVVSAVQRNGCWTSEEAVTLSRLHATISRSQLLRNLTRQLAPQRRSTPSDLRSLGFLHSSSSSFSASLIQARAYDLERLRKKQEVKRMLEEGKVGRSLGEVMYGRREVDGSSAGSARGNLSSLWDDASEIVRAALCPDIKKTQRFWETLASRQTG